MPAQIPCAGPVLCKHAVRHICTDLSVSWAAATTCTSRERLNLASALPQVSKCQLWLVYGVGKGTGWEKADWGEGRWERRWANWAWKGGRTGL